MSAKRGAKKRAKVPAKRGRPTIYSPEIAARICAEMAEGESLAAICSADDMPAESTVRLWALENRDGFSALYTQAVQLRAMRWAEEIVQIADDSGFDAHIDGNGRVVVDSEAIARARLRVDTRKWALSKLLPKVYGDRVEHEHVGPAGGPVEVTVRHVVVDGGQ